MKQEIWKPVNGFEGLYLVSSLGRVKSLHGRGRILKSSPQSSGYLQLSLYRGGTSTMVCVHRLVAKAFIGECPRGHVVHHLNGVRTDNRADNLQYRDASEHLEYHKRRRGKKLTMNDARTIRATYRDRQITQSELAAQYGVSQRTISYILNGERFRE